MPRAPAGPVSHLLVDLGSSYPKGNDTANHKKPSDEEALMIVKAIAKMSKRGKT